MPHRLSLSALALALLVALVAVPESAFAWGFTGHRRLASHLHEPFPTGSCLRAWLSTTTGVYAWQEKACDPDRWRNSDPETCDARQNTPLWCEWPRHYLDIDYANPVESYPRDWAAAEEKFKQYAVANGRVPWRVEELYAELVADFRAGNGADALETVAYLSHYVTDAASPMHTTKNQPGNLHTRYESDMLSNQTRLNALAVAMRGYYGQLGRVDPKNHTFDLIQVGVPLAQKIIFDDFNSNGAMDALYANTSEITARRFADGVTLMASLVGTAWVEAGSPKLSGMPSGCSTSFPETTVELRGYPLPQPQPEDGGTDGGTDDAGTGDEDGGGGGGGGGIPWVPTEPLPEPAPGGCGCASAPMSMIFLMIPAAAFVMRSRRRRVR